MVEIPLRGGLVALVDASDVAAFLSVNWQVRTIGKPPNILQYAWRNIQKDNGEWTTARMHRLIMDAPSGVEVDHINGNGLDNRRCNLRLCTRSENSQNMRKRNGTTSRFKGVCFFKRLGLWRARIMKDRREYSLGYFKDETAAAKAYNAAAVRHFGDFAKLNHLS